MTELQAKLETTDQIATWLEDTIYKILETTDDKKIGRDENMMNLGMDSVAAIQIQCAIEDEFDGVELSYDVIAEEPTINKIAAYIKEQTESA